MDKSAPYMSRKEHGAIQHEPVEKLLKLRSCDSKECLDAPE